MKVSTGYVLEGEGIPEQPSSEIAADGSKIVRIRIIGPDEVDRVRALNRKIFGEERLINTMEREDLLILLAYVRGQPVGFKIGYREDRFTFYSAKGGVLDAYRRRGIATQLLDAMCEVVRGWGYKTIAYDTFPNRHPGMTIMGLVQGFRVTSADYNPAFRDYRIRFERDL